MKPAVITGKYKGIDGKDVIVIAMNHDALDLMRSNEPIHVNDPEASVRLMVFACPDEDTAIRMVQSLTGVMESAVVSGGPTIQ